MAKRTPPKTAAELTAVAEKVESSMMDLAHDIKNMREWGPHGGGAPTDLTQIQESLMLVARDACNSVASLSSAIETAIRREEIETLSSTLRARRQTGKDN